MLLNYIVVMVVLLPLKATILLEQIKDQALFVVSGYERHCITIVASAKEQEGF